MTTRAQRPPVALRISVTDRCQLRCVYCMPAGGVTKLPRDEILSFQEIVRFVRVMKSRFGLSKVHVTGGEPLIRRGVAELIGMLAREGVPDLALTTNGQLLGEMASELKAAGLRRVNISLNSVEKRTYAAVTRGGNLGGALAGIEAALGAGLAPVKINTLVLRHCNDREVTALARFAVDRGCLIRFLELMPIGCAKPMFRRRFVPAAEVRARLEESFILRPLDKKISESSRDFLATDREGQSGIIGFIAPESAPFCSGCTRLRLTSSGQLVSCLARGGGQSVRGLLRFDWPNGVPALENMAVEALDRKRDRESFENAHPMVTLGG